MQLRSSSVFFCWFHKMRLLFALCFSATLLLYGPDSGTAIHSIMPKKTKFKDMPYPWRIPHGKLRRIDSLAFCSRFFIFLFLKFYLQPLLARNCVTNTGKLRHQMFFTTYIYQTLLERPRAIIDWRGKRVKSAHEARDPLGRSLPPLL